MIVHYYYIIYEVINKIKLNALHVLYVDLWVNHHEQKKRKSSKLLRLRQIRDHRSQTQFPSNFLSHLLNQHIPSAKPKFECRHYNDKYVFKATAALNFFLSSSRHIEHKSVSFSLHWKYVIHDSPVVQQGCTDENTLLHCINVVKSHLEVRHKEMCPQATFRPNEAAVMQRGVKP